MDVPVLHSLNQLLASLPQANFERIRPCLPSIELEQGTVLVANGAKLSHVYFPHSGVISLVVRLAAGHTVETAMIGRDSVFGGSTVLDGNVVVNDAIVQMAGEASMLDVQELRLAARQVNHSVPLSSGMSRLFSRRPNNRSLATRLTRSRLACRVGCCARDLSDGDTLRLTQVFLSQMLGVRRASVTNVAIALEEAGLVHCRRGNIQITDPDGCAIPRASATQRSKRIMIGCAKLIEAMLRRHHKN